jgi:Kae1-associated kinase Bud32
MVYKILQRGAEAVILLKNNNIIKQRVKKSYRLNEIDEEIRKLRTRSEAKLLEKASKIIDIPKIAKVNEKSKEISMEFIEGKKLSDNLDLFSLEKQKEICKIIGKNIAKLHNSDIIHGDLTTSNMIYVDKNINVNNKNLNNKRNSVCYNKTSLRRVSGNNKNDKFKIFFIDFGLGFISHKIEDKAVDLHLLKQALEARHFKHWKELFQEVQQGYSSSKSFKIVLEQLKKVEARGRYKEAY